MGATEFLDTTFGFGVNDMKNAYRNCVDYAVYDYGNDSCNGTISTTDGVRKSPISSNKSIGVNEAVRLINEKELYDNTDKWGDCEAVFVHRETSDTKTVAEKVEVDFEVDSEVIESLGSGWNLKSTLIDMACKKIMKTPSKYGIKKKANADYFCNEYVRGYADGVKPLVVHEPSYKYTTSTTQGKRVTKYFIVSSGFNSIPDWDKGYESQAEARKNLPTSGNKGDVSEIIAITRRESGEGLVKHTNEGIKTKKVKVSAVVNVMETTTKEHKDETGWLFYGIAAI